MRRHRYRIVVSGRLGEITHEVFGDLCLEFDGANTGLTGELGRVPWIIGRDRVARC